MNILKLFINNGDFCRYHKWLWNCIALDKAGGMAGAQWGYRNPFVIKHGYYLSLSLLVCSCCELLKGHLRGMEMGRRTSWHKQTFGEGSDAVGVPYPISNAGVNIVYLLIIEIKPIISDVFLKIHIRFFFFLACFWSPDKYESIRYILITKLCTLNVH